MTRNRIASHVLLAVAAFAPLVTSAEPPSEQLAPDQTLRVYDVRDLLQGEASNQILMLSTRLVTSGSGAGDQSPFLEIAPQLERLPEKDVLLEIAGVSGLAASRVRDGIYVVTGAPEAHEQLGRALTAFRAVRGNRYVVNIEAVQVASDTFPAPGQPAPSTDGVLLLRSSQTVNAQTESVVQATSTEQYVSGWIPVVGTQAVGYQVQFATAEDGFVGSLVVGAAESGDERVSIQLAGWMLDTNLQPATVKLGGDELPLSFVRRQERGIQTSIVAPIGQRVVLGVVNGFEPNTTIILTGSAVLAPDE